MWFFRMSPLVVVNGNQILHPLSPLIVCLCFKSASRCTHLPCLRMGAALPLKSLPHFAKTRDDRSRDCSARKVTSVELFFFFYFEEVVPLNTQTCPRAEDVIQGTGRLFSTSPLELRRSTWECSGWRTGWSERTHIRLSWIWSVSGVNEQECVDCVLAVVMLRRTTPRSGARPPRRPADRNAVMVMDKHGPPTCGKTRECKIELAKLAVARRKQSDTVVDVVFSSTSESARARGICVSSCPVLRAPSRAPISPALREIIA